MDKILVFGHKNPDTDSICSAIVKTILDKKKNGYENVAARLGELNKETQFVMNYLGMEPPMLIENVEEGQKVILVDHNEFAQSADGIEHAKIIGVIDHHRICNFETTEPLYYTAKPYGCTCTILYEMFRNAGIIIEKKEAILMLSAIISDTLLLKSPTTTDKDREAVETLSKIAGVEYTTYGLEMLKAGTDLNSFTIREILNLDAKSISLKNKKAIIAQVNTASIPDVMQMKEKFETEIQSIIAENNLDLFMFLITDIINSNSQVIAMGPSASIVEKAYNVTLEDNTALLARYCFS